MRTPGSSPRNGSIPAAALISDQALAWSIAEQVDAAAAADGRPARLIAREIRSALAVSTVASLTSNLAPELLAALVADRLWSAADALSAALQKPGAMERAEAIAAVAPHLPGADVLRALEALREGDRYSAFAQRRALVALAPNVTSEHVEAVWTTAESFAWDTWGSGTPRLPWRRASRTYSSPTRSS